MDSILSSFLQFGIGGSMACGVLWFLRHLVKVVIPDLVKAHNKGMYQQQEVFRDTSDKIVSRLEAIDKTLYLLAGKIEATDQHVRANREYLIALRDYLNTRLSHGKEK